MIELETPRLILKQFTIGHAPLLFELNSDPEVTQYTGDGAYKSVEDVEAFIAGYTQYEKYGMGRLNMFEKETGEYVGWCGLKYLEDINEVDLGYRLLKRHWGKGYATESSIANLEYGFGPMSLDQVIGTAMKVNAASINVFTKLGLKYWHDDTCGCEPAVVYRIKKEEWGNPL